MPLYSSHPPVLCKMDGIQRRHSGRAILCELSCDRAAATRTDRGRAGAAGVRRSGRFRGRKQMVADLGGAVWLRDKEPFPRHTNPVGSVVSQESRSETVGAFASQGQSWRAFARRVPRARFSAGGPAEITPDAARDLVLWLIVLSGPRTGREHRNLLDDGASLAERPRAA